MTKAKPHSWAKKTKYHVIDARGQDLGAYTREKTALQRVTEYDNMADVSGIFAPHRVEIKTTHKGNYFREDTRPGRFILG